MHLWACASLYSSEIPTKPSRWLILSRWPTQPLSPQALAPALFCRLPYYADCPVLTCSLLLSTLFYRLSCPFSMGPCLPSSSSGLVGNLAREPFVWVSRQNRQRDPLTGTHTHTHRNEILPSCQIWVHVENNASWCLIQAIQQKFGLSRYISKECKIINISLKPLMKPSLLIFWISNLLRRVCICVYVCMFVYVCIYVCVWMWCILKSIQNIVTDERQFLERQEIFIQLTGNSNSCLHKTPIFL